jgi:serine protease Do
MPFRAGKLSAITLTVALAGGVALAQTVKEPATLPAGAAAGHPPFTQDPRPEITRLPEAPLAPRNLSDLKMIQDRVEAVVREALPATVGILIQEGPMQGQGSGVIVSRDGYVLTAGHVSGKPKTPVTIVMPNGRRLRGVSLGANNQIDSGMVKITTSGDYPFVPLGTTATLATGQWAVALGHPGGYQEMRPPVLRLGRILHVQGGPRGVVATDCPLINGDSGGPVFDLDGRVIGINSKIGISLTTNLHVPVDTFESTWDRLAKGDLWGNKTSIFDHWGKGDETPPEPAVPVLGVRCDDKERGPEIISIRAGTPAEKIGVMEGDIVVRFDGQPVKTGDDLKALVEKHKPGDQVSLEVLRNNQPRRWTLTLGSQQGG